MSEFELDIDLPEWPRMADACITFYTGLFLRLNTGESSMYLLETALVLQTPLLFSPINQEKGNLGPIDLAGCWRQKSHPVTVYA